MLPQTKLVKDWFFGGWLHDESYFVHVFIKVFEVCWSLVFIPPNGYDTFVQQTSIPFEEIIPLPPNQIPLSLLMKISSSHHRFGFWWLCYLCLHCLQNIFLPLVKTLPLWWVCCGLSFRLLCRRGSSHPRFGFWWLRYLYLCCRHTNFLAFGWDFSLWEFAVVSPLVCRAAVAIELVCVSFFHVTFRLPFCLW